MTGEQDDRDELGGLLRRSAQGAAPLPYEAADTRGRADARRRRTAVAGGVGAAVAALGVTAVVATASGGSSALQQQPAGPGPVTAPSSAPLPTPSAPPREATAPAPPAAPAQPTAPDPAPATAGPSGNPLPTAPTSEVVLPTYDAPPAPGRPPGAVPTQPPPRLPEGPPETVGGAVELRGDDLRATRVGAPRAQAVAGVSRALGPPSEDPARSTSCVHAADEVAWGDFRLAFDAAGRVSGWATTDRGFSTPSGVHVGSTVAALRTTYGVRLHLHESNPDNPESYTVDGVQMVGYLTGHESGSRVTALVNGDCTGP